MSEVASRPSASRGRGSGRGSRGGFAGRGGRTARTSSRTNGDSQDLKHENLGAFEDGGEFGELRKLYGSKTSVIREMFPDWSEADVLFALQETNGDENEAVARIAEGTISQWGQVSNNRKAARQKAKESSPPPSNNKLSPGDVRHPTRGGRAVSEGSRGRGRGSERGGRGGAGRGRPVQAASNEPVKSIPTEDAFSWDTQDDFSWDTPIVNENTEPQKIPVAEIPVAEKSTPVEMPQPGAPTAKTWASMLRQTTTPKPAPAPVIPKKMPAPMPALPTLEDAEPNGPEVAEPAEEETTPVAQHAVPAQAPVLSEPDAVLPPPDDLTETNLEQVVDVSNPPATDTARSTTADSWDPRQSPVSSSATPISAAHQQHQTDRSAASSGFATSALKATAERSARVPSLQRRVLDQEEPVRMPGNREVDRAAVKFGAFSLNDGEEDVDGEREEPETRAQPPAESPVAHPRASLPPVSHPVAVPEAFPQRPAGVPSAAPGTVPTAPAAAQAPTAHVQQQYGRFGPADSAATTATAHVQKPVGPFHNGAQTAPVTQPPFDSYSVPTSQPQVQGQQPGAAFTSAPSEYSNYYTASHQERTPYNAYAQQQYGAHGQHDGASQQRPFAGYNAADNLSQYPQSGSLHNQPRFGGSSDSQNSGHSTPNPAVQAQQHGQHSGQQGQQGQQSQQSQQAQQGVPGSQPQTHGQYPGYSHPYYSNPYYHQYYSGYGQGGFGPYGGKGGMYGQPYGMSPNAPYDHSSSPSTFAGAPSSLHRDSSLSSGLGEYGRSASGQTGGQPASSSSYGGAHDSYARGSSALQSQGQSYNSQNQAPASGSADELKPFGDGKANASGPSPSLGGGPRPGSAANNAPSGQSGLPPQNSQIGSGGYGGYPSHLQGHNVHGSGYGMGGAGGGSQHGSSPYGNYGQGFGSGGYYGGGQQQRGGWGGNYH